MHYKRIIFIFFIIIIFSIITIICLQSNDKVIFKSGNINDNRVVNSNALTMMYETDYNSGEYQVSSDSMWPQEGYVFNEELSSCENGSTLTWNSENNTVSLQTNISDKCYVYFDKLPNSLNLDISLDNIVINVGSSTDKLYVSGGGLSEQIEIDNTLPVMITGSTEEYGIEVYGGTSNIILSNVNIKSSHIGEDGINSGPIRLENDAIVNLTIEGENSLEAMGSSNINKDSVGIYVPSNSKLIINGDGLLNVIGKSTGIGTNHMGNIAGTIIINSGTINATSTVNGAAIGGFDVKLIEINGGNITAISNGAGAGIGGTESASVTGQININGGTVYAQGGTFAAGIGGGGISEYYCPLSSYSIASNIYVSDFALVTAYSGIGGGTVEPEDIGNGGNCM